jgi:hypothetical protein
MTRTQKEELSTDASKSNEDTETRFVMANKDLG